MERRFRRVLRSKRPVVGSPATQLTPREPNLPAGRLWLRRSIVALILIGMVILVGWGLQWQTVKVEPAQYQAQLEPLTRRVATDHRGWHNLLLLKSGALADELNRSIGSDFSNLTVHKNWFSRSITVKVGERRPTLRWRTGPDTYVLDERGVAASQSPGQVGESLPLVIDGSNLAVELNKNVVSADFVTFATNAVTKLEQELKIKVKQYRITDTTAVLFADTNKGYFIKFDTTEDLDNQVDNIKQVLKKAKPTQYLDVRIPYKAYYR